MYAPYVATFHASIPIVELDPNQPMPFNAFIFLSLVKDRAADFWELSNF